MFSYIRSCISFYWYRKKWRKLNLHNETAPVNVFRIEQVSVGKKTYGGLNVIDFSSEDAKLIIGNYCSISPGVIFLLGGEHQSDSVSTYPFKAKCFGYEREAGSKGNIIIKDDVWIGANVIICSGVKIGQGAIVAAGAVVVRDVESYAIVGGNPASVIRYRFSEKLRSRLSELNLCHLFDSFTGDNIDLIYEPLSASVLEKLLNSI